MLLLMGFLQITHLTNFLLCLIYYLAAPNSLWKCGFTFA